MNDAVSGPVSNEFLKAAIKNPGWRIRNLYWITDKQGRKVLFKPWPEQEKFMRNLWFRNLILKARQRGFSTLIQLMMLDTCLFNDNVRADVIAQDRDTAERIFRDKIRFAYDNLPPLIRDMNPLVIERAAELVLRNNSSLHVSTSARGGTLQFLHVSEFGKICARFPDKAHEIVTGSLPAVDQNGITCIESTAQGQEGAFYDMATIAQATVAQGKPLTKLDYRFHFAAWWDADEYQIDPGGVVIAPTDHAYFLRVEARIGRDIPLARRAWYVKERDTTFAGDRQKMHQEYPSYPEEAFEQSTEGVYLADQLARCRREGRITTVPYDPRFPVDTLWDLGLDDTRSIWFRQKVGLRRHFIRFIESNGEPYSYDVRRMQEFGYVWGTHYLPHDGGHRRPGAEALLTDIDMLESLGLRNIEQVPRIDDVTRGIQQLRDDFGHYWFDETLCAEGLKHLGLYRKTWNERQATWSEWPAKNGHDHAADALRQGAQWDAEPHAGDRKRRRRVSGMAA